MKTEATIKLYKQDDNWIAKIVEGENANADGVGRSPSEALEALAFTIQWNEPPAIIDPNAYRKD